MSPPLQARSSEGRCPSGWVGTPWSAVQTHGTTSLLRAPLFPHCAEGRVGETAPSNADPCALTGFQLFRDRRRLGVSTPMIVTSLLPDPVRCSLTPERKKVNRTFLKAPKSGHLYLAMLRKGFVRESVETSGRVARSAHQCYVVQGTYCSNGEGLQAVSCRAQARDTSSPPACQPHLPFRIIGRARLSFLLLQCKCFFKDVESEYFHLQQNLEQRCTLHVCKDLVFSCSYVISLIYENT